MLFAPLAAEEAATGLIVHPFWVLVSIVNFLVLLLLLSRYLWVPINRVLDERAAKIREGLEMAEAARADRQRIREEAERVLADARRQSAEAAERATSAAEAAAAEIRAQAKAEAERIRERAQADAAQFHEQALARLRAEVADMVVLAAGRVLGRELDGDKHRELIRRSLEDAGAELQEVRV